jgi:hypothetical protein
MNRNAPEHQTTHRIPLIGFAIVLTVAITVALPRAANTDNVTQPPVPSNIQVPTGSKAFLVGHAIGTQEYICLPCPNPSTSTCANTSGFAWILFRPQATLFRDNKKQIMTHFFSPDPFEANTNPGVLADGMIRPTWQDSQDTSAVWAIPTASSSDADFVAPNAIPWLRLDVVGAQDGPSGGHKLSSALFIHRLNTVGGVAPSTGCALPTDVGKKASVPYLADYFF